MFWVFFFSLLGMEVQGLLPWNLYFDYKHCQDSLYHVIVFRVDSKAEGK